MPITLNVNTSNNPKIHLREKDTNSSKVKQYGKI